MKVGEIYRKFYNENNFNNIDKIEIRGIVDDFIIVCLCTKGEKLFYQSYNTSNFLYLISKDVLQKLEL